MKNFSLTQSNISREDLDLVIEHLKQPDPVLINGPYVGEFEKEWSAWLGVKYSVFLNSGASANLLSMAILKLEHPEGGEIIVPSLTWVSDITSVLQNGFTPVFVDVNPRTLSMEIEQVIAKLTDKTRAVFITYAQGFDALSDVLLEELEKRDIPLIEDVSQSHGACHKGRKVGSIGYMSNFSFHHSHHMSTIEGGMLCTNDENVYQQARMLRSHGMVREVTNDEIKQSYIDANPLLNPNLIFAYPAYNLRNTEIGAILGRNQLKRLNKTADQRTENFEHFLKNLDASKYWTDYKIEGSSNFAFNLIQQKPDHEFAKRFMETMKEHGLTYRRGSVGGGNQLRQPYLENIVPKVYYKNFPVTDHIHFFGFYIGNFPDMTFKEVDKICEIVNSV